MTTTEIIRTGALRAGITTAFARGRRVPALQVLGAAMVGSIVLFSLVYPLLPGYDPFAQDLSTVLAAPGASAEHWLGTDALGRDEASRLALAGRVTLGIVLLIVVVNSLVGMAIGTWSGYVGGRTDNVLMGLADIQLAMPVILVLIALAASLGPSVWLMITVLAATYWVGYARVARSTAMALRDRDFVLAPRIQGRRAVDRAAAHRAERRGADDDPRLQRHRRGDAAHLLLRLPRPRRAGADAQLGPDDQRGPGLRPPGAAPRGHPRRRDLPHGRRHQPAEPALHRRGLGDHCPTHVTTIREAEPPMTPSTTPRPPTTERSCSTSRASASATPTSTATPSPSSTASRSPCTSARCSAWSASRARARA
ncbi:ABC transporter permease [Rathayibacter oskolensis]|uniref:ABC transporter permease n=1 Tax=Rathayibacter oskolensis TaxID=1891671 RepID=UPI00265E19C2|nr:ABC transporter permease [Rathayibacter oskolensis]WKK72544.1 ABC transporter permease [Rathayibacter oskolensis]